VCGCGIGVMFEYKEGCVFDWMVSVNKLVEKVVGDVLIVWFMGKDVYGVVGGNVWCFGIMYIIWNCYMWCVYCAVDGW